MDWCAWPRPYAMNAATATNLNTEIYGLPAAYACPTSTATNSEITSRYTNHCAKDLPMPGSLVTSVRKNVGPRLRFSKYSGCCICAGLLAYGAKYWPLGMFSERNVSNTASSLGNLA